MKLYDSHFISFDSSTKKINKSQKAVKNIFSLSKAVVKESSISPYSEGIIEGKCLKTK